MNNFLFLIYIIVISAASLEIEASDEAPEITRTDRYTLIKIDASDYQRRPLLAITTLSFSKDVLTVGDAINETLIGSGFRWQSPDKVDQLLNNLPLPAVVRELGPIRLVDALQTIAGESWMLRTDNLHRVVWFDLHRMELVEESDDAVKSN